MKLAIMQPYFFPYIGYFQLINAVDEFVIYDNIQFSKGGWIQRNRILSRDKKYLIFSLPLKHDSDYLNINERSLSGSFSTDSEKILRKINAAYIKAPYYSEVFPIIKKCFSFHDSNLFNFIYNSIAIVLKYLEIETKLIVSSEININHNLKSEAKVIAICKSRNAEEYINSVGGKNLYSKENFKKESMELYFIKKNEFYYVQFGNEFIPDLSIIDVMMFNPVDKIREFLKCYTLI